VVGSCTGSTQCCTPVSCNTGTKTGVCISTSMCTTDVGTSYPGFCPGSASIQCCVQNSCTYSGSTGKCMDTASCGAFGGTAHSGLCKGAANVQCCIRPQAAGDDVDFADFTDLTSSGEFFNGTVSAALPTATSATTGIFAAIVAAVMAAAVAIVA